MSEFNRREFLKKSILIGTGLTAVPKLLKAGFQKSENIDISVVTGRNYFENVIKSIEKLGGISKFVPGDQKLVYL